MPLADVIAVNLDHYRLDTNYKHGMHFTVLPTDWVSGFDKNETLKIGSSTAWTTDTPGASAGFLEYTGQSLTTFERAMDRDERLMSVLGARLLESPLFLTDLLTGHEPVSGRAVLLRRRNIRAERQLSPTGFMGSQKKVR